MCASTNCSCGTTTNNIAEFIAQKFGRQRIPDGTTQAQKSMNQFQFEVVYPTNWRGNWSPLMSAFPQLGIRYGGFVQQPPYFQAPGYAGVFPMSQQPLVSAPQPYTLPRYS